MNFRVDEDLFINCEEPPKITKGISTKRVGEIYASGGIRTRTPFVSIG